MRRFSFLGWLIAICILVAAARADQQVKLESGATLVGNVTMDGATLSVDVDGAKLEVPFKDVASVTPAASGEQAQAQRLLLKGLESQVLAKKENAGMSLFAEAHRLAPEDPHVAFWYARSLLDAGFGQGASEVFEPKRAAIVAAYPGIADRLASQIADRIALEKLPAALVKRIDQIAAAAEDVRGDSEYLNYAAYFRLVDQTDQPIAQSDFRITCNGEDESLEAFPEGYYLFKFRRRRSFPSNGCELNVTKSELVSNPVKFRGSYDGVENVGELRVKRLNDADRRPVIVKVVDSAGKPVVEATANVYQVGRASHGETNLFGTTSADGIAKLSLFPGSYSAQLSHPNYARLSQPFTVPADAKAPTEINVQLHRAMTAKIKAVWRSKIALHPGMPQQDDAVTTGEFEQEIGPGAPGGPAMGRFGPRWVQLVQKGDQVQLEFVDRMHFPSADASWVGRWKREADAAGDQSDSREEFDDVFDMLDLAQLSAIKQELQLEVTNLGGMPGQGRPTALPMEEGDIYLGRISGQDPSTGRPASIEFKILAVELKRP